MCACIVRVFLLCVSLYCVCLYLCEFEFVCVCMYVRVCICMCRLGKKIFVISVRFAEDHDVQGALSWPRVS